MCCNVVCLHGRRIDRTLAVGNTAEAARRPVCGRLGRGFCLRHLDSRRGRFLCSFVENNPGSEAQVPVAQEFVPVLSPTRVAEIILNGLAAGREEIIAPWQLRLVFLASRLFPSITGRQMRGKA